MLFGRCETLVNVSHSTYMVARVIEGNVVESNGKSDSSC